MTKVDIISGFLGAGKTTLIKKLLEEAFTGEKLALIENEFGEIGIDGTILKDYGIKITEMNSGCICCTIAGDFSLALKEILKTYKPDRIIIEPSGVGKLSDVIKGCRQMLNEKTAELNICITVVDGMKYKMYVKNFAEFYKDQLMNAKTILLSRSQYMKPEAIEFVINDIKKYNRAATIVTTEWEQLKGTEIVKLAENVQENQLEGMLLKELYSVRQAERIPCKAENINKDRDIQKEHHHADDVFSVWSRETARIYDYDKLKEILKRFDTSKSRVLRAKGIVKIDKDRWVQFDYVPGENNIKETKPNFTGKICVIGEHIDIMELSELFCL